MSDDDFGDFAEAIEEEKIPQEILLDNSGRPIDYLPSINLQSEEYFSFITSMLCEPLVIQSYGFSGVSDADFCMPDLPKAASNELMLEFQQHGGSKGKVIKTPMLADLLIKQGEQFCRDIWPGLSIRGAFLRTCEINENANGTSETLPIMTEMDTDNSRMSFEGKKVLAKEYLGSELPDLSFMLAGSIQWPSEYLKQI